MSTRSISTSSAPRTTRSPDSRCCPCCCSPASASHAPSPATARTADAAALATGSAAAVDRRHRSRHGLGRLEQGRRRQRPVFARVAAGPGAGLLGPGAFLPADQGRRRRLPGGRMHRLPRGADTGHRRRLARQPPQQAGKSGAGSLPRLSWRRPPAAAHADAQSLRRMPRRAARCLPVRKAVRLPQPRAGHGARHRQQAFRGQAEGRNHGLRAMPLGGDQVRLLPHATPLRRRRGAPRGGLHHLPQRPAASRRRKPTTARPTASATWPTRRRPTGASRSRRATT